MIWRSQVLYLIVILLFRFKCIYWTNFVNFLTSLNVFLRGVPLGWRVPLAGRLLYQAAWAHMNVKMCTPPWWNHSFSNRDLSDLFVLVNAGISIFSLQILLKASWCLNASIWQIPRYHWTDAYCLLYNGIITGLRVYDIYIKSSAKMSIITDNNNY